MTKKEIIYAVTELMKERYANEGIEKRVTMKGVGEFLDSLQDVVYSNMDDEGVKLFDGLILRSKLIDERSARNPRTGETITVPAHRRPVAKFGKLAKESVNALI